MIKIAAIAIITAFCVLVIKESRPDIAVIIGIVGGLILIFSVLEQLSSVFVVFKTLIEKTNGISGFIGIIIKIVGIGFIVDFSASICEDIGQKGLAEKVVLAGKISIVYLSLPIITTLFELITSIV